MKILWVNAKDDNVMGKSELWGLSESLIKMGHEIRVIHGSKKNDKEGYIKYVSIPFGRLLMYKLKLAFYLPWWALSSKYDFIIVDWQSAFVPALLVILVKLGLYKNNLIHDIRTIPVRPHNRHGQIAFKYGVRISRRYFLGMTTITSALKRKLSCEYNIPDEKIGVWSSGVDLELFYPRDGSAIKRKLSLDGKFVVFYHGSVGYKRGICEAVEAFMLLKDKGNDIHFVILGSGQELETVRRIKEDKDLANVHIHPPVDYKQVPDYISISDVCIVPLMDIECWRVSSPLKVMEYLAMGKAIICTDIIAHREVIKNNNDAFFISDINPETLCNIIEKAYSMRGELYRMGKAGLRNARENCSWDIQAERVIKYLEKVRA
jgi:glycosyltransferase involved in cell wall biosynthesis